MSSSIKKKRENENTPSCKDIVHDGVKEEYVQVPKKK